MAHDASHNLNVSGADPKDRLAEGVARYGAKTVLFLVLGVLLFALGHPTKGAEVARIIGRLRKRHIDLIVGRVMDGLRLAEEMRRRDAERQAAEMCVSDGGDDVVGQAHVRERGCGFDLHFRRRFFIAPIRVVARQCEFHRRCWLRDRCDVFFDLSQCRHDDRRDGPRVACFGRA